MSGGRRYHGERGQGGGSGGNSHHGNDNHHHSRSRHGGRRGRGGGGGGGRHGGGRHGGRGRRDGGGHKASGLMVFSSLDNGEPVVLLCQRKDTPAFFSFLLSSQVGRQFKYAEEFPLMSREELTTLAEMQDISVFWDAYWKHKKPVLSEAAKMFCDSPKLGNAARRVLAWIDAGRLPEKYPFWGVPRGRKRPRSDINYSAVAGDFELQIGLSPSDYSLVTTVDPYQDRYNVVFYAHADAPYELPEPVDSPDVRARRWCTRAEAEDLLAGDHDVQQERLDMVLQGFDNMAAIL
ncbi:uncharacterized protein AMSG_08609 [Thecamonas trahens ATCC 50062]|uniref:Uncharacterized protein n=1 Tax=Thecamonas trahens ATCC 50062 TaxID=461836 RepID=A0A0L0DJZ5_THETB|nr:hypothetical protein AMSG_08609 [Thecamonas trahens ATCC 50062]KNC52729.1 hypothetical protein AMSG_08609 [Thecamonas trahens ATCC 50062]|eukprot:XP_013755043.1 hypothetical protein AMSG_08609 [Thecamonas trahens ATCC 50062]